MDSPAQDVFGIGRYALSVTFDGRSLVNPASLPAILRGPYDSLSAGDIAGLLIDPAGVLFNSDLHTNVTFLTAEPLQSRPGYPADTSYDTVASLNANPRCGDLSDPGTAGPCRADRRLDREPDCDAGQRDRCPSSRSTMPTPIRSSAQVLLNGNGTYIVQAIGLTPGATYYLQVSAAPPPAHAAGNYALVADFGGVPAEVQTFVAGTLSQVGSPG